MLCSSEWRVWTLAMRDFLVYMSYLALAPKQTSPSTEIVRHDLFHTSNPLTCSDILKQFPSWLPLLRAALAQHWDTLHLHCPLTFAQVCFLYVSFSPLSLSLPLISEHYHEQMEGWWCSLWYPPKATGRLELSAGTHCALIHSSASLLFP